MNSSKRFRHAVGAGSNFLIPHTSRPRKWIHGNPRHFHHLLELARRRREYYKFCNLELARTLGFTPPEERLHRMPMQLDNSITLISLEREHPEYFRKVETKFGGMLLNAANIRSPKKRARITGLIQTLNSHPTDSVILPKLRDKLLSLGFRTVGLTRIEFQRLLSTMLDWEESTRLTEKMAQRATHP